MNPWLIVAVVLMSVLVGATLPVLFQLHSTLRETRRLLARLGPKLDATLADVKEVTHRARATVPELEKSAKQANGLLHEATEMARSLRQLRRSIKVAAAVGSALGPAVATAVQTFLDQQARSSGEVAPEDTPSADRSEAARKTTTSEQGDP